MAVKYKRVMLKLSGEALSENGRGFSHDKFDEVAKMLIAVKNTGVELAVVIGGGNVWRGGRDVATRMGRVAADQIGMLGTLQNCLYMQDALIRQGAKATVLTAVDIPRFATPYNTLVGKDLLQQGHIVLLACGLGNPCFSTDSAVVLRSVELECDGILMAKNIDGVYTSDPAKDANAKLISSISYQEAAEQKLAVVDATAYNLLIEHAVPMLRVFAMNPPENILQVLAGDTRGTTLKPKI